MGKDAAEAIVGKKPDISMNKIQGKRVQDFVEKTGKDVRIGVKDEHKALLSLSPSIYFYTQNPTKNRDGSRLMFDQYRVKLKNGGGVEDGGVGKQQQQQQQQHPQDPQRNYIHANWIVDAHSSQSFILTQAPMKSTAEDFWNMIWENEVMVLCCLLDVLKKKNEADCFPYFPRKAGKSVKIGSGGIGRSHYIIHAKCFRKLPPNLRTGIFHIVLEIENRLEKDKDKQKRPLQFINYGSWEPKNPWPEKALTDLALLTLDNQRDSLRFQKEYGVGVGGSDGGGHKGINIPNNHTTNLHRSSSDSNNSSRKKPPIVIHCLDGVTKSGTFAALCILLSTVKEKGKMNVESTVRTIRKQRYGTFEEETHHSWLYHRVMQFVTSPEGGGPAMISAADPKYIRFKHLFTGAK